MRRNLAICIVVLLVWKSLMLYVCVHYFPGQLPGVLRRREAVTEQQEDDSNLNAFGGNVNADGDVEIPTPPAKQRLLIVDWNNAMKNFGNTTYGACVEWDSVCQYSQDRSRVAEADAVLFDLVTIDWADLPPR